MIFLLQFSLSHFDLEVLMFFFHLLYINCPLYQHFFCLFFCLNSNYNHRSNPLWKPLLACMALLNKHMHWHITRHWGNLIYLVCLYLLCFISSNINLDCAFKLICGSQAQNGEKLLSPGPLEAVGPQQEHRKSATRRQWEYRLWSLSFEPLWLMLLREKVKGFAGISLHPSCVSTPCEHNISKVSLRLRVQKWPTLKMPLCSS